MDERTLKALRGSIKKWEDIVAGVGSDNGSNNCPLCAEFYDHRCTGCPVMESTGRRECINTPYYFWKSAHIISTFPLRVFDDKTRKAAQAELDFLRGLLPQEKLPRGVRVLSMQMLWQPIKELEDKYSSNLLLRAPELVNLDCNEHGVGIGYWQGGFVAAKWSMTNDEWCEVKVTPTHFCMIVGPEPWTTVLVGGVMELPEPCGTCGSTSWTVSDSELLCTSDKCSSIRKLPRNWRIGP